MVLIISIVASVVGLICFAGAMYYFFGSSGSSASSSSTSSHNVKSVHPISTIELPVTNSPAVSYPTTGITTTSIAEKPVVENTQPAYYSSAVQPISDDTCTQCHHHDEEMPYASAMTPSITATTPTNMNAYYPVNTVVPVAVGSYYPAANGMVVGMQPVAGYYPAGNTMAYNHGYYPGMVDMAQPMTNNNNNVYYYNNGGTIVGMQPMATKNTNNVYYPH
jgi:hypothetical protein